MKNIYKILIVYSILYWIGAGLSLIEFPCVSYTKLYWFWLGTSVLIWAIVKHSEESNIDENEDR